MTPQRLSWSCALLLVGLVLCFAPAEAALASNEMDPTDTDCTACHNDDISYPAFSYGPHGAYSTTSRKCSLCHQVHDAVGGVALLPGPTVKATCETCHDGTGGGGVYGAIKARTGSDPAGGHRVDITNIIPGGSALTGQETTATFVGEDGMLGCDDCHSPHDGDTVNPFQGERFRGAGDTMFGMQFYPETPPTSKLLKRQPTTALTAVDEYGSDWCAGCHAGRSSGGVIHNHPVDSFQTQTTPFNYNNVAVLDSDDLTSNTILRSVADGAPFAYLMDNRAFLMPEPRTPEQSGHAPICQQCHEDARNVGTLTEAGADAEPLVVTPETLIADQNPVTDNPRFQNFPHEAENRRMLIEVDDDLCMNCHVPALMP